MLKSNLSTYPYRVVQFLFTVGEICFVLLFLCQITVEPHWNDTACYYREGRYDTLGSCLDQAARLRSQPFKGILFPSNLLQISG